MPTLDSDQQGVVAVRDGQYCVLAGPGAGKTTTLVARYRALVESGVPKTDIICVTFTKEAADTMMKRASGAKEQFATFHSLGYRICRQENGHQPVEPELRHRLLFKLCSKWGLEYKDLETFISKCRRQRVSPSDSASLNGEWKYGYARAYGEYEVQRALEGWIDFESMLIEAADLLEQPEVRARWQFRFPLADEMQDSDNIQWRMLQLMSEKHGNVMVVGDVNQSIYAWRDARPEHMLNFVQWFSKGQYLYLGRNYRSTHTLVAYIRKKAPVNTPLNEKMVPARFDLGEPIEYRAFMNEFDEAESAVVCANQDPLNSAIIARTNRMLAPVENFCIENNIKYQLLGRSGFWKQSEIMKAINKLKNHIGQPLTVAVAIVWAALEKHYLFAEDRTTEDNDAWGSLLVLRDISKKFTSVADFVTYANRCAHAKRVPKGITIGTIHSAKGLEWKNVFVNGAQEGMMPHKKSLDHNEERRIWFVACSRAIDRLRISWSGYPSIYTRPEVTPEVLAALQAKMQDVERLKK